MVYCVHGNLSGFEFNGWRRASIDVAPGDLAGGSSLDGSRQFLLGTQRGSTRSFAWYCGGLADGTREIVDLTTLTGGAPTPVVPTPTALAQLGTPVFAGVTMALVSEAMDGMGIDRHYRVRLPGTLFVVDLWYWWVPGQGWAEGELSINACNPALTTVTEAIPSGFTLTFTGATCNVFVVGIGVNPSAIMASGGVDDFFFDGQLQQGPVILSWPILQTAESTTSTQAVRTLKVGAHAVQSIYPGGIGDPEPTADSLTWVATELDNHIPLLWTWESTEWGVLKNSHTTGSEGDQMYPGGHASRLRGTDAVCAEQVYRLIAYISGRRPSNHVEVSGEPLDFGAHPNLRINEGRPHYLSPDLLGKPNGVIAEGNDTVSHGWYGPWIQHMLCNGTSVANRLCVSPAIQHQLRCLLRVIYWAQTNVNDGGVATWAFWAARADGYWGIACHWLTFGLWSSADLAVLAAYGDAHLEYRYTQNNAKPGDIWQVSDESTLTGHPPLYLDGTGRYPNWLAYQHPLGGHGMWLYAKLRGKEHVAQMAYDCANSALVRAYDGTIPGLWEFLWYDGANVVPLVQGAGAHRDYASGVWHFYTMGLSFLLEHDPSNTLARTVMTQLIADEEGEGTYDHRWLKPNAKQVTLGAREALCAWVTLTGIRKTSATDTVDLSIQAEVAVADGGLDRVEFIVRENGVERMPIGVTAASVRRPDFVDVPSKLPGAPVGALAPFAGYGITLAMADYAAGTLEVSAIVYSKTGVRTVVAGTVTIYNHKDGTLPPCTRVIYVDFDAGNDSNDGLSWATAVASTRRAQQLVRNGGVGASTLAGYEAGGGRIIMRGTGVGIGTTGGAVNIHTTGDHWLTFEADPVAGCRISRLLLGTITYTAGRDTIYAGVGGQTTTCRIKLEGIEFLGAGPVIQMTTGCTAHAMVVGCDSHSVYYQGAGSRTVRQIEDDGQPIGFDGPAPDMALARRYAVGCSRRGCMFGFAAFAYVYDCEIADFLGVALQISGTEAPALVGACYFHDQDVEAGVTGGYLRLEDASGGTPVPTLVTSVSPTGGLRITGPIGGVDFGMHASGLLGSPYWGVWTVGLPSGCNSTTAPFAYVGHGTDGTGAHFLDLACPTATAGTVTAGSGAKVYTARFSDNLPVQDVIHGDGVYIFRNGTGDIVFDVAMVNMPNAQPFYVQGLDQDRLLVKNVRDDGGNGLQLWAIGDASFTDCIFRNITSNGTLNVGNLLHAETLVFTGTEITNCSFRAVNSNMSQVVSGASLVDYNHWTTGSAYGTHTSTGTWFAGTPTSPPYSMEPTPGNLGTGSPLITDLPAFAWSVSGSTRGVMRNVGLIDWSIAEPDESILGSSVLRLSAEGLTWTLAVPLGGSTLNLSASGLASTLISNMAPSEKGAEDERDSLLLTASSMVTSVGAVTLESDLGASILRFRASGLQTSIPGMTTATPSILYIGGYHIQGGNPGLNATCDGLLQSNLRYLLDRDVMRITPDDPATGAPTATALGCYPWYDGNAGPTLYTISSSSTTTIVATGSPGWTINQWAQRKVTVINTTPIAGVGFAARILVTSNTANTLTFAAQPSAPTAGAVFFMGAGRLTDYHPAGGFLNITEFGQPSTRGGSSWQTSGNGVGMDATFVRELLTNVYKTAPYFHIFKYGSTAPVNTGWGDSPNDSARALFLDEKAHFDAACTERGTHADWKHVVFDSSAIDLEQAAANPIFVLTYESRMREAIAWLRSSDVCNNPDLGVVLVSHRRDLWGTTSPGGSSWFRGAHNNIATDTANVAIVDMEGARVQNSGQVDSEEKKYYAQEEYFRQGTSIRKAIQRIEAGDATPSAGGFPVYLMFGDSIMVGTAVYDWTFNSKSEQISGPNSGNVLRPSNQLIWNNGSEVLEIYEPHVNSNTSGSVTNTAGPELSVMAELGQLHPDGFALIKRSSYSSALTSSLAAYNPSTGNGGRWLKAADEHYTELQTLVANCFGYINATLHRQADVRGAFVSLGHNDQGASAGALFASSLTAFCADLWHDFGTRTSGKKFPIAWRRPQADAAGVDPEEMALVREAIALQMQKDGQFRMIDADALERDRTDNLHETPDSSVILGRLMAADVIRFSV